MAICSYVNSAEVFDIDLESKITDAIENMLQENDSMEFLCYSGGSVDSTFMQIYVPAVLLAKQRHPEKEVLLVGLIEKDQKGNAKHSPLDFFPENVFDKILEFTPKNFSDNNASSFHLFIKAIIRHSDYFLSHLYSSFHYTEETYLNYVKSKKNIKIYDLTNPETTAFIQQSYKSLPEKKQEFHEALESGKTIQDIAAAYNMSPNAVKAQLNYGSRELHRLAKQRYWKMLREDSSTLTCGILLLGNEEAASFDFSQAFYNAAQSIMVRSRDARFLIADGLCAPVFQMLLHQMLRSKYAVNTTVKIVTTEPEDMSDQNMPPISPFDKLIVSSSSPGAELSSVEQVYQEILKRSDVLICSLSSASPLLPEIKKAISTYKNLCVYDLSHKPIHEEIVDFS